MTHANKPSTEELRHAFVDLNLTQRLLSIRYGVPENTIKHWLAVANITKSGKTPLAVEATAPTPDDGVPEPGSRVGTVPDADELRRLYVDLRLSDNQIGPIYGVPGSTIKSWRRRAGLAGARKAEQADSLARFVAEAKARAAALPDERPLAPAGKKTFTPAEARPYLSKASQSPVSERARSAAKAALARKMQLRQRWEFNPHEERAFYSGRAKVYA